MKGDGLLTRLELAKVLDVNPRTINRWQEEGLPIKEHGLGGRASRYDEAEVRTWVKIRNEAALEPGKPLDLAVERARKEHWQAELAEQMHQMRSGKLLLVEDVERIYGARVTAARTKLLSIPVAYADRLGRAFTLGGLPALERALEDAMHEVMRELAGEAAPAVQGVA